MSRSALAREKLGQPFQKAAAVPPPPPPGMMYQPQMPMMQAQMPMMPMMPMAGMGVMGIPFNPMAVAMMAAGAAIEHHGEEEEEPEDTSNKLPMHGNKETFNINNLLFNNVMENEYFRALYQLKTYHEVIDEIYRSVQHVEPWQQGTARFPSSAICLLVKFMLMKLSKKQMKGLLETKDCAFVRAIGLLYLRYSAPPTDLWKWYEPFLEDDEEIYPSADSSLKMTIGSYCIKLLTDMQYFGTCTFHRDYIPLFRPKHDYIPLFRLKHIIFRYSVPNKHFNTFCLMPPLS